MILYHATEKGNALSILRNGLNAGFDGCVYFADSPENAMKFLFVKMQKGEEKKIAVFPVNIDDNKVNLSDDHNKDYFKCDAYYVDGDIEKECLPQNLSDVLLFKVRK